MDISGPVSTPVLFITGPQNERGQAVTELDSRPAFEVHTVETVAEARQWLSRVANIGCLLLAHDDGRVDGLTALDTIREEYPELPVVLYPTAGSKETAVEALSAGATEYLEREEGTEHGDELACAIRKAIDAHWLERTLHERLKELQAIRSVAGLLTEPSERPLEALLEAVSEHITEAFRYLDVAEARLIVDELQTATDGYTASDRSLTARTVTVNNTHITVEVVYTVPRPDADDGPFLDEERELLETLVTLLRGCIERRTYIEELAKSEQLFRELAENINEVVWITDSLKEEMLYVNPAYETVWGRSVESVYADPLSFLDAVHPDDFDRVEGALRGQLTGGGYDEEYRILQPNGRIRWIHDRSVPVQGETGDIQRIVGLAEDITERKEREQQVAVLNRVLRHNLRNEVNAIQAYATLIADRSNDRSAVYADRITTVATRLMALADKNRQLAAQLSEQIATEPVDLTEMVRSTVAEYRTEYPNTDITLTVPDACEIAVTPQLEIAVSELLENAAEHNDSETPTIGVTTSVSDEIEIRIRDNGPGIPSDEWTVLGSDEIPLLHGSGVGLWLAHWVVTGMGGSLTLEESNGGSTVIIRVPRISPDQ